MNHHCFRCDGKLKDETPKDITDIRFLSCESCPCQYTQNSKGRIHDRWLMPMTIPLYMVIFEEDPLHVIDAAVKDMRSRKKVFKNILVQHITEELENPRQKITDIHDFMYPNEDKLREFLRLVKEGIITR